MDDLDHDDFLARKFENESKVTSHHDPPEYLRGLSPE